MDKCDRNLEKGKKVAYECGAEYQANPGSDRKEYLDSAAYYFKDGCEFFKDLTDTEKTTLIKYFNLGIEAEKECQ